MGKRRARRKKDEDITENEDHSSCLVFGSSKRDRRLRKKQFKKLSNIDFDNNCQNVLTTEPFEVIKNIPDVIPQFCIDSNVLSVLSSFMHRYIDTFDTRPRTELAQFYDSTASLTLQITPYFYQSDPTKLNEKFKFLPQWSIYEKFAVNILPGAYPLQSWIWHVIKHQTIGGQRIPNLSTKLSKHEKQTLKAVKSYQAGHKQRLVRSMTCKTISSSDQSLNHVFHPPKSRTECRNSNQIVGLLSHLPKMIHIKDDRYSHLDVFSSEPLAICFRFSCLVAELVDYDFDSACLTTNQLVEVIPYGRFLIRSVHRAGILSPQYPAKIIQEDLCFAPVSDETVQQCTLLITEAVTNALSGQQRYQPGFGQCLSNDQMIYPPPPPPLTTFNTITCVHSKLVSQFSIMTGMNSSFALQCLTECNFDLQTALGCFKQVQEAGLLPSEAFL